MSVTCNQPFNDLTTNKTPITLGGTSSGYTFDCLATLPAECALLTGGAQGSLFVAESDDLTKGGFIVNGPTSLSLSSGAYANGGPCCTATQVQASRVQVTDSGAGIIFYYNSGLTAGNTFTPTEIGGINSASTLWATGGVQPNSASAGGSGGYSPEAFPLGVAEQHPKILSGSCSVTAPSTVCTFPNGFMFADTTYNCAVSAEGTGAVADSYTATTDTSITIYSATTSTFSYICTR